MMYVPDRFKEDMEAKLRELRRCELSDPVDIKAERKNKKKNQKEIKKKETTTTTTREKKLFEKPSVEEIDEYLKAKQATTFTAEYFFNYYEAIGWTYADKQIVSWERVVDIWIENDHKDAKRNAKHKLSKAQTGSAVRSESNGSQEDGAAVMSRRERLGQMLKGEPREVTALVEVLSERADQLGVPQEVYSAQDMLDSVCLMLKMPDVYGEMTVERLRTALSELSELSTDKVMGRLLKERKPVLGPSPHSFMNVRIKASPSMGPKAPC